jgi:hypothetical protein
VRRRRRASRRSPTRRGTVERIRLTRRLQAIGFTLADASDALAAHGDRDVRLHGAS